MDKETINRRDAELLKKVDTVIQKILVKKRKRLFRARLLFFFITVGFMVPAYTILKPENGNTSAVKERTEESPEQKIASQSTTQGLNQTPPPKLNTDNVTSSVQNQDSQKDTVEAVSTHSTVTEPENITEIPAENIPSKILTQSKEQTTLEDIRQERNIRVSKNTMCAALNNRNPVDPKNVFVVGQDKYAIAWTEIRTAKPPIAVKHVYYLNGEKYCEVPLSAKYTRTRTWSKISLIDEKQVGSWEVVVIEESGNTLKQMAFDIKTLNEPST